MEKTFKNGAKVIEVLKNGYALGTISVSEGKTKVYHAHIYGTGNTHTRFESEDDAKNFLLQSIEQKRVASYDTTSREKNFSSWGE